MSGRWPNQNESLPDEQSWIPDWDALDDDEALQVLIDYFSSEDETFESEEDRTSHELWMSFFPWLTREATPEERHQVANNWNWDSGPVVLSWITSRPDCDKATALLVFWLGQPEYFLEYDGDRSGVTSSSLDVFDLLTDIRRRWQTGHYRRAELAFDYAEDVGTPLDFAALEAAHGERARIDLPPDMRTPLAGQRLERDDSAGARRLHRGHPAALLAGGPALGHPSGQGRVTPARSASESRAGARPGRPAARRWPRPGRQPARA